jgi:hypothetical protein
MLMSAMLRVLGPGAFVVAALVLVMVVDVTGAAALPTDCADASSTCFQPDFVIAGVTPRDPFPWLTVEIEEIGTDIFLTMRADFDKGFIGKVWMNVANSAWLPALTFDQFEVEDGSLTAPRITKRSNKPSPAVGQAGKFDLMFQFEAASGERFNRHDEFHFRVTCPGCVDFGVEAFDALSTGGSDGAFHIAANLRGVGGVAKVGDQSESEESEFFSFAAPFSLREEPQAVPYPTTLLLVGAGLAILIAAHSRQRASR